MYTTEQFNNDVQKLRDLMNKCEELEKKKVIKLGTNVKSKIHDDLEAVKSYWIEAVTML